MIISEKVGKYEIVPSEKLIVEYYSGEINLDDLIHMKKVISNETNYNFYFNTIVDLRDVIFKMEENDMNLFLDYFKNKFELNGTRNVAYLTSDPDVVVCITLFSSLSKEYEDLKLNPATFSTIDSVSGWLDIEGVTKEKLNMLLDELKNKPNNVYEKPGS